MSTDIGESDLLMTKQSNLGKRFRRDWILCRMYTNNKRMAPDTFTGIMESIGNPDHIDHAKDYLKKRKLIRKLPDGSYILTEKGIKKARSLMGWFEMINKRAEEIGVNEHE